MTAEERRQQVCVTSLTIILCLKKNFSQTSPSFNNKSFCKRPEHSSRCKVKEKITTKNRFASTAVVALSHLLHTNVNAILFFLPFPYKRSLYQFRRFDGLQKYPYLLLAQWFAIICITVQCFIQESIAFFIFWCYFRGDESKHNMNLLL